MTSRLPPLFSFLKTKDPSIHEILDLLEAYPSPAILIEKNQGKIIGLNTEALKLITYSRAELISLNITSLFPSLGSSDLCELSEGQEDKMYTLMAMRNGSLEVVLSAKCVGQNWLLILLESKAQLLHRQSEKLFQNSLIQILGDITFLEDTSQPHKIVANILASGRHLLTSESLFFYQKSAIDDQFAVYQTSGTPLLLPETFSSQELSQLRKPILWKPGTKILSSLHRAAREHQWQYLASAPVGDSQNPCGLLVACDTSNSPPENLLPFLQLIAQILANRLEHLSSIETLKHDYNVCLEAHTLRQKIIDNIQDGVILLSSAGTITEMNTSAEIILGYAIAEVKDLPLEKVLISVDNLQLRLSDSITNGNPVLMNDITLHRRDGQSFAANIHVIPIQSDKKTLGTIILLRDLSEYYEIKIRTQQLEERAFLGEVTAIFAHEVRNPINNISMGLQLIQINLPPDDPNQAHIERIKQDCDRLTNLMSSVLSFSRSASYKMEPTDLSAVIERLVMMWKSRMARDNIQIRLQKEEHIPLINGNASALEQVFNNLIRNSFRAMQETGGGSLYIKISQETIHPNRQMVQVDVGDTGPGIPEEYRTRIFEPFFTTDKEKGTGLGLAITNRIITAHKGSIRVESFPSGGSVFHLQFPALST